MSLRLRQSIESSDVRGPSWSGIAAKIVNEDIVFFSKKSFSSYLLDDLIFKYNFKISGCFISN